ncbi:MAG TPA: hypothetical protein VGS21_05765 [Acidimicrobiales bacterium]|nr:hypothetical protein [Acidimicrobiales bacterium]
MSWNARTHRAAGRIAGPFKVLLCLALASLSIFAVSAASSVAAPAQAGAISIGDSACGKVTVTPNTNITGGTAMALKIHWLGSASSSTCPVPGSDCPTFFGQCSAGYWLIGLFCSTLAAANISGAQGDCDLNNIMVLTDNNKGPNNPHGTSWNQCSTVSTLGSIFGGLPGNLNCVADGDGGNYSVKWPFRSAYGTMTGPAEQTGSSVPFNPATSGVDCPPSAANIAAGAIPNMCVIAVLPIEFTYYCAFDVCAPDVSLPNDGAVENTSEYIAVTFLYSTTAAKQAAA